MRVAAILIGISIIFIGFLPVFMLFELLINVLGPSVLGLTEAEAEYKCELLETSFRWGYDGGVFDCVDHYATDESLISRILDQLFNICTLTILSIAFILGGGLLLHYSEIKSNRING